MCLVLNCSMFRLFDFWDVIREFEANRARVFLLACRKGFRLPQDRNSKYVWTLELLELERRTKNVIHRRFVWNVLALRMFYKLESNIIKLSTIADSNMFSTKSCRSTDSESLFHYQEMFTKQRVLGIKSWCYLSWSTLKIIGPFALGQFYCDKTLIRSKS